MPGLSSGTPGHSEFSHGRSRHAHPDSDYQTGVTLPWEVADRAQGAKRGGLTSDLLRQEELRMDGTKSDETTDEMMTALGNPDMYPDTSRLVEEKAQVRNKQYKQPLIRNGVDRNIQ